MMNDDNQSALTLWYVVNASLSAYYKLTDAFGSPKASLSSDVEAWQKLGIHKSHIARLQDKSSVSAFLNSIQKQTDAQFYNLIYQDDEAYPKLLGHLFDPPPVLFYRGNIELLNSEQIAIVGTRQPTDYAKKITFDLAGYLVQSGFVITSGLAEGVDGYAHKGALAHSHGNATVGVMGTGIDVVYPKPHRGLFEQIVENGGCLVTELLPNTQASKHTFPRRNRLVAGLARATVVTEAATASGSLITARLTAEQGKQVFVIPGQIDNPNSEGCHHLIREGATLIYHPSQILEELSLPSTIIPQTFSTGVPIKSLANTAHENSGANEPTPNPKPTLPQHLAPIYEMMRCDGRDLDSLVIQSQMDTGQLLAALIELELLGLIHQMGGRYAKT